MTLDLMTEREVEAGPPVEVGWIVLEPIEELYREAIDAARAQAEERLVELFPQFAWSLPLLVRRAQSIGPRVDPVELVEQASHDRAARSWDFAFVVTSADLLSRAASVSRLATSRVSSVAVVSTLRIDPAHDQARVSRRRRIEQVRGRLCDLFMRAFARLNGVDSEEELSSDGRDELLHELTKVADLRVEESRDLPTSRAAFYWRSVLADPGALITSLRQLRPWRFPLRLGRMSSAALSVAAIMLFAQEAWDLGTTRSTLQVIALASASVIATLVLMVARLGLLSRGSERMSEIVAVRNVTTVLGLGIGLISSYLFLLALVLITVLTVFDPAPVSLAHAGTVAAVAQLAGGLGASFEEAAYFRYIAQIDREW
jgi:hypothetical protein